MVSLLAGFRRSRVLVVGLLLVALVVSTTAIVAAVVTSNNGPFTGCLSKYGVVYNAKVGAAPLAACARGDTQIAFSNGQGAPAADPCADKIGTYLQTGAIQAFDQNGQPVPPPPGSGNLGRVISLLAGGGMMIVNADSNPDNLLERQSPGQGVWSCSGNTVTARTLDLYHSEPPAFGTTASVFEVDRVNWTATFSAPGTLTGTLTYCSWSVPVPAPIVQANACDTSAASNPATFTLTRDFTATRITQ